MRLLVISLTISLVLVGNCALAANRWSQWVDATLACNLLAGVSNPKVFRGR